MGKGGRIQAGITHLLVHDAISACLSTKLDAKDTKAETEHSQCVHPSDEEDSGNEKGSHSEV